MSVLVLFPAMAVDAPGAGWQNAFSDTRKHFWYVLGVTILPFIPIALLLGVVTPMLPFRGGSLAALIATMAWSGALLLVSLTFLTVIASRLYQIVGDRLNAPAH